MSCLVGGVNLALCVGESICRRLVCQRLDLLLLQQLSVLQATAAHAVKVWYGYLRLRYTSRQCRPTPANMTIHDRRYPTLSADKVRPIAAVNGIESKREYLRVVACSFLSLENTYILLSTSCRLSGHFDGPILTADNVAMLADTDGRRCHLPCSGLHA